MQLNQATGDVRYRFAGAPDRRERVSHEFVVTFLEQPFDEFANASLWGRRSHRENSILDDDRRACGAGQTHPQAAVFHQTTLERRRHGQVAQQLRFETLQVEPLLRVLALKAGSDVQRDDLDENVGCGAD